jgi:hypothetical protein
VASWEGGGGAKVRRTNLMAAVESSDVLRKVVMEERAEGQTICPTAVQIAYVHVRMRLTLAPQQQRLFAIGPRHGARSDRAVSVQSVLVNAIVSPLRQTTV